VIALPDHDSDLGWSDRDKDRGNYSYSEREPRSDGRLYRTGRDSRPGRRSTDYVPITALSRKAVVVIVIAVDVAYLVGNALLEHHSVSGC